MGLILTLDAALGGCSAGLVDGEGGVVERRLDGARGHLAALPLLAADVLGGRAVGSLEAVAVTVGPGSFTGLRAALALAHGIGLAAGRPVLGVTVGAAISLDPDLWTVIDSRRGRVFLERDGVVVSVALDALPEPVGRVRIAGDAAIAVASRLAARGASVLLTAWRRPMPAGIAAAARARPVLPRPLYVDPPAAQVGARPSAR